MSREDPIIVHADWRGLGGPTLMGRMYRSVVRGEEILSFEYEPNWLKDAKPFVLDPRLQFVGGRQHTDASNPFGLLTDSAPDRWGRLLIRRRAALELSDAAPILFDSDYLLAVSDTCRMGALRFSVGAEGPFLAEDTPLSVPPLQGEERIHFASAMNLLGYQDGDGAKTGASYLDLVDLIERYGAAPKEDLEELWRRVVFNVCVNNTDDHLRNHGFLLSDQGWKLSPAYDLNAQPWGSGLALNIDENSNACELDLVRSVGPYFRLSETRQEAIIQEVAKAVKTWEKSARNLPLKRSEVERFRVAFRRC